MRLALFSLALPLLTLPIFAQTPEFSHVSQSSATIAASFSRRAGDDGKEITTRGSGENLRTTVRYKKLDTVRFGNADLLEVLVPAVIPDKKGWALLAVWADWDNSGVSSHRFYVRKKIAGVYDTRRVPDTYLKLDVIDPYVAKTVKLREDTIVSGTDQFKASSRVFLAADPLTEEDESGRATAASTSLGIMIGSGRYARPSGASAAFYLPNAFTFNGNCIADDDSDFVSLKLKLGKASAVASARYDEFEGVNPSRGVDAVATPAP